MKKIFSTLTACLFAAVVTTSAFAASAKVTDISPSDLRQAVASKKVVLLDANGSDSYKEGHIPGAIDFSAHEEDLAKVLPEDKSTLIVAYCRNEACGAYKAAAKEAQQLGYTNVKHFAPGIEGWKSSGAPVEKL
ncbi:MAG TPA: rhodanese-like domain-containing protein [Opitutaceae bacterium]